MMKLLIPLLIASMLLSCSKARKSVNAAKEMKNFIVDLSTYAKDQNPNFAIIPQNGLELLFLNLDGQEDFDSYFLGAINGIGTEELFYNGTFQPDDYRLDMLLRARANLPIFVADYVSDSNDLNLAYTYNTDAGFVPFPRNKNNYDYQYIPDTVPNQNTNDIQGVGDAKNYLYLISDQGYPDKTSYLAAIQNSNFDLIIMDAFYGETGYTSAEIEALKTKKDGGKRLVISYISVGSAEKYRYYWQDDWKLHKPRWLKKEYEGYPDEIWVKFWKKEWKNIIYGNDDSYVKKIINAGFDGAYLDNVEAYYHLYFDE